MANPNDIRTYHGIYMDPFSAKESEIDIRDIVGSKGKKEDK